MKAVTLLFVLNAFLFFDLQAQESQDLKMPEGSEFFREMFTIEDHIWAIDSQHGKIFLSKDEGQSWILKKELAEAFLLDVKFLNKNIGFFCGIDGFFIKTSDGGQTWEDIAPAYDTSNNNVKTKRYLYGLHFQDERNGIVQGWDEYKNYRNELEQEIFYCKTKDGGKSWERIDVKNQEEKRNQISDFIKKPMTNNKIVNGVVAQNGLTYKVASNSMSISEDGGRTWIEYPYPQLSIERPKIVSTHFISDHQGYIFGGSYDKTLSVGFILETLDGGRTWYKIEADLEHIHSTIQLGKSILLSSNNGLITRWTPVEKKAVIFIQR